MNNRDGIEVEARAGARVIFAEVGDSAKRAIDRSRSAKSKPSPPQISSSGGTTGLRLEGEGGCHPAQPSLVSTLHVKPTQV